LRLPALCRRGSPATSPRANWRSSRSWPMHSSLAANARSRSPRSPHGLVWARPRRASPYGSPSASTWCRSRSDGSTAVPTLPTWFGSSPQSGWAGWPAGIPGARSRMGSAVTARVLAKPSDPRSFLQTGGRVHF